MITFHTDEPITGETNSPDLLNRGGFAERVAKSLVLEKNSPGLIVSLEGKWGYGKTSTINLISHSFYNWKKADQPIVFNFNPWMIGNAEKIVQEFLVQFAAVVGSKDRGKNLKGVAKQLIAYSNVFDVMKFIPGAEPWASITKSVFKKVGEASKSIGELKQLNYEQKRNAVIKALAKINKPIVVFIDDLDRLPPDEVYQMIRVIKVIADFPRTVFVLAFDPKYIEEALEKFQIKEPSAYLDKIVQVRLPLPQISATDLHEISVYELERLATVNLTEFFPEDQKRFSEIYHLEIKHLWKSPRDIKRIFNRLRFIEPVVRREVAFSDLFGLQFLAIKAPEIYDDIKSNPDVYTGVEPENEFSLEKPEEHVKKFEEHRNSIINKIDKNERRFYSNIIDRLFPLLAGESWGFQGQEHYRAEGRVAAIDRLMIALTFGLPTGEVATSLVKNYLTKSNERSKILKNVFENESIERFVELLNLHIDTLKPEDKEQFLAGLAELSSHPKVKEWHDKPRDIMLGARPVLQLFWVARGLLDDAKKAERKDWIFACVKNPKALPLANLFFSSCLDQHGFYNKKKVTPEKERWLTANEMDKLKGYWKKSVTKAFEDGNIFNFPDNSDIAFLLKRIDKDLTEKLVKPLLKKDEDLDNLARLTGVGGTDSQKGHFTKVHEDFINALGGREAVKKRIKKRLSKLPENEYELRAIYQSFITGDSYYTCDATKCDGF
jgi:predicted KAP-like P-loop ATPase